MWEGLFFFHMERGCFSLLIHSRTDHINGTNFRPMLPLSDPQGYLTAAAAASSATFSLLSRELG